MASSPMTGKKPSAMFDPSASRVKEVKNFPRNMEISSQMNYNGQNGPLTLVVRRSIVELDKDPMPMRYKDRRVGYFSTPGTSTRAIKTAWKISNSSTVGESSRKIWLHTYAENSWNR